MFQSLYQFYRRKINFTITIEQSSKDFELPNWTKASYLYIFNLRKNMSLLEVFEFGDKFTGLKKLEVFFVKKEYENENDLLH